MTLSDTHREQVAALTARLEPELTRLALDIHAHPELGFQERLACAWQVELLRGHGFTVEEGFCGIDTAYRAVYDGKAPGPHIAYLAEYDALPVLGHGCGHNLIAMVSCGCGIVLRHFVEQYGGRVCVIGTPAEETAGAKIPMARQGAFDEFDAVLMAHPAFMDADAFNTMAMCARKIEFFGKPSHAAGAPELGVNALDAMINFFNLVNALRQQIRPDARIHGIITDGGTAANVIPDYTAALFYIRANRCADARALTQRVRQCAEGAALGTGCRCEFSPVEEDFMDTCSNQALNRLASARVEELIGPVAMRLGGMYVPGSSDLGDVSYRCPAVQLAFKIGDSADPMTQHTEEFARCAGTERAVKSGLTYVQALSLTGIDLLTRPEILAEVKEEFSRMGQG